MKKGSWKTPLMLGIVLAAVSSWVSCQRTQGDSSESRLDGKLRQARASAGMSISIRNGSESFVEYTAGSAESEDIPFPRILESGEIDTFTGGERIRVVFHRSGEVVRRELDPGRTYSFVRDDLGELTLKEGWHGLDHPQDLAPFVATPIPVAVRMLEMAEVGERDRVYDLGSGDGRIVILAAERFGARGVGIDFNPTRIRESLMAAERAGVSDLVEFRLADVMTADFSDATVVTVYLLTRSNENLRPLFEQQLKPGTRVAAHNYRVPGWEHKEVDRQTVELEPGDIHIVFLYRR
jgi:hypothetical protein